MKNTQKIPFFFNKIILDDSFFFASENNGTRKRGHG